MTAPTTQDEPHYGLRIVRADADGEAVIRVRGELEMATTARMREELARALATECGRVVVDLRALDFLDSTGIHALVQAHERCRSSDRSLTLLLGTGPVHRTLDICGLLDVLNHVGPDAVAA
jgi:anti-sigma B factor antagonist